MPFTGEFDLFHHRPSTYTLNPPRANVRNDELVFTYDRLSDEAKSIKTEFDRDRKSVASYLGWIASDVEQFNSKVREDVARLINARREKLLGDRGLVEELGFPLKRRSDAPTTYISPAVKRRIIPQLPSPSKVPYVPEPTLAMEEYDYILSVISNMVLVMERSPRAFKGMREDDLRQHFLVQLNGQYESQASGETFNYEGKTDIIIRSKGRNIFIAECKFWNGQGSLHNALDQLLSYTSWRDTKTALLIFNCDREMSTVLKRVPDTILEHCSFKAECPYESETGFRFVLGHRDDRDRDLMLTVLVFDVPR